MSAAMVAKGSTLGTTTVEMLVGQMSPVLRERFREIGTLLEVGTAEDARVRYRVGVIVRDIMAKPDKYGRRAVHQIASALGRDDGTMYDHARIARTWSPGEFEAVLARLSIRSLPLSYSHFAALSTLPSRALRDAWIERALSEGLGARELRRLLATKKAAKTSRSGSSTRKLKEVIQLTGRLLRLGADLRLEPQHEPLTPALRALLERTLDRQRELADLSQSNALRLARMLSDAAAELRQPLAATRGLGIVARCRPSWWISSAPPSASGSIAGCAPSPPRPWSAASSST
jgi:signal transduction histidine kinase